VLTHCPVVTIRCYPWSAGSWQVFHIIGLYMFSHQSADYSIVVAHMAQDPLVEREPVSASCNRRPDEGLETHKYSLYPKEHPVNGPLRWRLSNVLGCISNGWTLDLRLIPLVRRRMSCWDSCCHSHCNAASSWRMFCTGGSRACIHTRYWTLNNRCRQVIHKWRLESEVTILSCFLNCEGQYLEWTCFTDKTGLVV
jgi:hypothetical protein